jgi:molybdopterin/thiamine biosynthesis adenylyltransferase
MPAFVTVMQSQLDMLLSMARARRLRVVEGVAFGVEGEGVFHVFASRPAYQPAGSPLPCFFVIREGARMPDDIEATLLRLGARAESPVVVVQVSGADAPQAFLGPSLGTPAVLHLISPLDDAASRTRGIMESDVMAQRRVFVVGLGSFGSTAAVELAKAGVGNFVLVDMDRLEPGNMMRHHCGVADIGRFKTFAVRDAILAKNPGAQVQTFECDINTRLDLLRENARSCDVMLCLTDQGRSRFNCNSAAVAAGRPALFARAITRAAGGDVFRFRPGGPCLACLFSQGLAMGEGEVGSERKAASLTPDYAPSGADRALVQPGLACDIAPLVQMLVKLALVELASRGVGHWDRLREDFSAPFYIWANRRELIYRDWLPMEFFFNRNSIMRWYGVRVPRASECMTCGLSYSSSH